MRKVMGKFFMNFIKNSDTSASYFDFTELERENFLLAASKVYAKLRKYEARLQKKK